MRNLWIICLVGIGWAACNAGSNKKELTAGIWQARLHRQDGADIVFNFDVKDSLGKKVLYIINATERMLVDEIQVQGDSLFIKMPFFDSEFKAAFQADGSVQGKWIRHLADKDVDISFSAVPGISERFKVNTPAKGNVSGRWATSFKAEGKDTSFAVGEFKQEGNIVHGTFLTRTGDYRFLDGVLDGDTLKLSTFDGSHAYLFTAQLRNDASLEGTFYAGIGTGKQQWLARKDAAAALPDASTLATLKKDSAQLNFRFPDMTGKMVSIKDDRFKNKVVVIALMGSWCPNCMDETNYLSEWYKANKDRGVEIIGLSYERTPDFETSRKSLSGFLKRFDVQYPVLITGVTPSDPQKGEKTLPQLSDIKGFPTTIFVDKKGNVKEVHTGFSGPGTGEHYETFKTDFNKLVDGLLQEQ